MSAKSARQAIIDLGVELAEQEDRSYDLWTRLPSYKAAQQAHGDFATEHRPSVTDVMFEATLFIAHGLQPTPEQIEAAGEHYRCPCGEDHEHS